MIEKFFAPISNLISKAIPDKTKRMELESQIRSQMIDLQKAQSEVNLAQAKHASLFVAGARPAIMWICALGLLWSFFLGPIANWLVWTFSIDIVPPDINTEGLMTLTLSMLGLGGMRSFEKFQGVARNNMKEENVKDSYKP
ncbi:MAG: hypothetical protein Tp1100SUR763771_32 [Prokaryotic dsDNA virus sp.]|jgi:hypothetical protein|nr:MAG: hypothetical protein Tp1100SUR763771_32 [Prokaryotic dsDNA virus sp.]|tara:strand:+ start:1827 stop:2249 length:423 start_codon:yes stop_codon:yes gene_type:complete